MKKLLIVLGILVLALPALAQYPVGGFPTPSYYVDYYANNQLPGAPDQIMRVINSGQTGTPLTVPTGNICANFYVFDNNQEMIECCACLLTPNELASASVATQLTGGTGHVPLTGISPASGVIKLVLTLPNNAAGTGCDPTLSGRGLGTANDNLGAAYMTHAQATATGFAVTETVVEGFNLADVPAGAGEITFLPQTCGFVRYLGSGRVGTCGCSVPGM